jgi:hypothetical protein
MYMSMPSSAVTSGPDVVWKHIDGPMMSWAGSIHWLTWRERARIALGLATVDQVGCERWPQLARLRKLVVSAKLTPDTYVEIPK